jgi:hypothetical protein
MAEGFTFGATMRGFFIVIVAFLGGMVVAGGGDRQGWEGGKEEVGMEREARQRSEGCSMCEPAGVAGNGGRWENWEEYGENRPELGVVARKGAPGVGLALSRGASAPDRILLRGSFIGLGPAPVGFCGRGCGRVFGSEPK